MFLKNASSKPAGISEAFEKDGIWKIPDGSTVKLQDGKYSMESEGFLETGIYTCFVNEDSSYIQFRPDSENNARFLEFTNCLWKKAIRLKRNMFCSHARQLATE